MDKSNEAPRKGLFWILILLVILQTVAIGMALYFGKQSVTTNRVLLERTGLMTEEFLPGMRKDLGEVSQKASEIKDEVAGLKTAVGRVEDRVANVDQTVDEVGQAVGGMNQTLIGFIQDRTSLIWGHSLNPYLLLGILGIIAVSIPLSGLLFSRARTRPSAPLGNVMPENMESFSQRLSHISELVEKIRAEDEKAPQRNAEIRRLMQETERALEAAREELTVLSGQTGHSCGETQGLKRTLH
jgi:septal ring factor EnvC (AmiA/AmiB activator)